MNLLLNFKLLIYVKIIKIFCFLSAISNSMILGSSFNELSTSFSKSESCATGSPRYRPPPRAPAR